MKVIIFFCGARLLGNTHTHTEKNKLLTFQLEIITSNIVEYALTPLCK